MAIFTPDIFRAYDIRGIYGEDFDTAFAERLGGRVASYMKAGTIVVGRDGRPSSDALATAVIEGAKRAGARVIDIGLVSSPQCYWAINALTAVGAIMVTASHNPETYNGFKVIGHGGQVIGGGHLRQIYDGADASDSTAGSVEQRDIVPDYAHAVMEAAGWSRREMQVAVDAPTSVHRALELMGPIAPDHGLAVRFDTDGDRISFFEHGRAIAADWIFLLLTDHLRLSPVVFDLRFSRAVRESLDGWGSNYRISRVGHVDMVGAMHETGALLGAETSGHYYWERFGGMESPELVFLHILQLVHDSGRGLGELIAPYMKYTKSQEVSVPVADRKAAERTLEHLKVRYSDGRVSALDGLTVEYADWWFNVRPSNTEPVLRLIVEAEDKEMLDQKVEQLEEILRAEARGGPA